MAAVTAVTAVTKVELLHRGEHLRKSREDHFLGQFSTENRLVLVPEAHFDGVGS